MDLLVVLYLAALFTALTPGVLLSLPPGGSKLTVAVVHGIVFAVIFILIGNLYADEGFKNVRRFEPASLAAQALAWARGTRA